MANNYVLVNPTGLRHAQNLLNLVNAMASVKDHLELLKLDMDQMTDAVTFTTIETAFGLPAGKGQQVYNIFAGASADLQASVSVNQLISWFGATR